MKKIIAIFYGGVDGERSVSLRTMETVRDNIDQTVYDIATVEITADGDWMYNGQVYQPNQILGKFYFVFIAGHGKYTEDGQLQKILDNHHVPYNGTTALMSNICFSKSATKELLEARGINTCTGQVYDLGDGDYDAIADTIFQNIPQPCIIKPDRGGSSVGVSIATNKAEIATALQTAAQACSMVLAEEYIQGIEATVGVIEQMRDQPYYALPPVEIVSENSFFDFDAKYTGASEEICPARFDTALITEMEQTAIQIHRELHLDGYSRIDYIYHPKRGLYVLEVNTLPGLTDESLLPKELAAVGISLPEFLAHIIALGVQHHKI